eukprot:GEMP01032303.1.p1 GENE.GEMP01032303.1~~GEMP01032303.1.p1  ORF type:complete len:155 (+),score=24.34 GEMP01032303.1:116-580(+)
MPGLRFNVYTFPIAVVLASMYFYFVVYKQGVRPVAIPKMDGLQVKVKHRPTTCLEFAKKGDLIHLEYTLFRTSNAEQIGRSTKPITFKLGDCSAGELFCQPGVVAGITGACMHEKRSLTMSPKVIFNRKGNEALKIDPKESLLMHFTLRDLDVL